MKKFLKENIQIIIPLTIAMAFVLWATISASNSVSLRQWFNAPLSQLTKGDIVIFIFIFALWMRK